MPFDRPATATLLNLCEKPIDSEDLIPFYEHFYRLGFFSLDGLLAADILDIEPPSDHLAGPLAVHLETVAACNLTCSHCFAGELPRNDRPLSLMEMDALFASFARMGSFRLGLTGGEPLLRRDIFEIIDAATDRGLHPCMTTNGLLITEEIAREFGRRKLVWLNVSLDGATAQTNDHVRGAGTFEKVVDKLRLLGQHARFTVAFTIMSTNAHEVEECAALARDVGAHTAVFRPLYPAGVALQHLDLMPTYTQYADALERLTGDIRAIDPFSPQSRANTQSRIVLNNGCGAGNFVCSVSVNGDVNPCSFLGSAHNSGNVRHQAFEEIWHASHGFVSIRNCGDEAFCGGCRARALAASGSIHAKDPWVDEYREHQRYHPMANVQVEL